MSPRPRPDYYAFERLPGEWHVADRVDGFPCLSRPCASREAAEALAAQWNQQEAARAQEAAQERDDVRF